MPVSVKSVRIRVLSGFVAGNCGWGMAADGLMKQKGNMNIRNQQLDSYLGHELRTTNSESKLCNG
jgi:hypothetical protein